MANQDNRKIMTDPFGNPLTERDTDAEFIEQKYGIERDYESASDNDGPVPPAASPNAADIPITDYSQSGAPVPPAPVPPASAPVPPYGVQQGRVPEAPRNPYAAQGEQEQYEYQPQRRQQQEFLTRQEIASLSFEQLPENLKGNIPKWLDPLVIRNGGVIPEGESGFSFAAFFFNFIYLFYRSQWKIALVVVAIFAVMAYLSEEYFAGFALVSWVVAALVGVFGRSLSYLGARPHEFPTPQKLRTQDKKWVIAAVILLAIPAVLFAIVLVVTVFAVLAEGV